MFKRNNESALIAYYRSEVVILQNTSLHFTHNSGEYGGAIALFDCSYIIVYPKAQLYFSNNFASSFDMISGSAIYSGSCALKSMQYILFITMLHSVLQSSHSSR